MAKEVYGGAAAVWSLGIFALYSLHIGYSTTSSSEIPYLFFVLAGFLGFFVHRRSGSLEALCLSGLALGIGAGVRYEAWVCIFALFLILVLVSPGSDKHRQSRVAEALIFGAVAGAWPFFWMFYQWRLSGKVLYGVAMNYSWVSQQLESVHRSMLYKFALPTGVLLLTLTPVVISAGIFGLWVGVRNRRGLEFCIVVLLTAAAYGAQLALGGLLPMARYTITLGTFAAIAAGYGFERASRVLSHSKVMPFRVAVGAMLAANLAAILVLSERATVVQDKFAAISPLLRFPRRIELVRDYLVPRLRQSDGVVIDDYNVESNIIAAAIGLPLLKSDRAFLASEQPISQLPAFFDRQHPQYLIYSNQGVLRATMPLPPGCSNSAAKIRQGIQVLCLFEDDTYRVYAIKYE